MKKADDNVVSKKKVIFLGSLFCFVLFFVISGLYFLGGRVLVSSDQGVTKPTEIIPRIEKGAENFSEIVVDWAHSLGRNPENNSYKNWQTYKSEQLGIELKYPEGWGLFEEKKEKATFVKNEYRDSLIEDKSKYEDTDVPYWGGKIITVENIKFDGTIRDYIAGLYGDSGIVVSEIKMGGNSAYRVEDRSPDRFGGGSGFYYYIDFKGRWYELGLDFFLNQDQNYETITNFNKMAESLKG